MSIIERIREEITSLSKGESLELSRWREKIEAKRQELLHEYSQKGWDASDIEDGERCLLACVFYRQTMNQLSDPDASSFADDSCAYADSAATTIRRLGLIAYEEEGEATKLIQTARRFMDKWAHLEGERPTLEQMGEAMQREIDKKKEEK